MLRFCCNATMTLTEDTKVGIPGLNSRGKEGYTEPCPPDREHRYFFRLYALSDLLRFSKTPTPDEVEEAVQKVLIEKAALLGRYKR